jgi:aminoglycoside phosphotransferase family enzyme
MSAELCIRSCAWNRNPRQDYSSIQTPWGPETLDNETPSGDGTDGEAGSQTAILQNLATPGVLGVDAPKRMMTHGAYVFLAGDRAYKLKRDVKYSYMDFSTQAQRDAAALAESHINRRTAPALYLGLAPVFNNGGDIRIGAVSDDLTACAQEHLVVMRRFDETQTLDVLADAGAVDGALAERLAVQIAHFHNATPGVVVDGAAMKLASISGRTMRDLAAGADVLGDQTIAQLHEAMQATLIQALSEVDERGQAGLVRRLHGDLHLGNVALIDGAPVIFDALEFDDAMATVDVLHDAAFLGMDLWTRGLQDVAARMWSRYLAERQDYSGLALAPVFFSMRAAVRAKTALHRAGLSEGEDAAASQRTGSPGATGTAIGATGRNWWVIRFRQNNDSADIGTSDGGGWWGHPYPFGRYSQAAARCSGRRKAAIRRLYERGECGCVQRNVQCGCQLPEAGRTCNSGCGLCGSSGTDAGGSRRKSYQCAV